MPIISNNFDEGVCPDEVKGGCGCPDPGVVVNQCEGECPQDSGCQSCTTQVAQGTTDCSPCSMTGLAATEPILNRDACCARGTASPCASTACHESFRGTTRTQVGHVLVKAQPGDKCLQHLQADEQAFMIAHPTVGSYLTRSPNVDVPVVQGFKKTVTGSPLLDSAGLPILNDAPEFTDLWISGVINCENRLFKLRAPNVTEPIFLVAENGCWRFASSGEKKLCSDILPDQVAAGRLLVVDRVADCEGEEYCVKELNLGTLATCAHLTVTSDTDGFTQIGHTLPTAVEGFLRTNPDDLCSPVANDVLTAAEITQLTAFFTQIFCDPEIADGTTPTIERVVACGSRADGSAVTTGPQSFTLQELYDQLQTLVPVDETPDIADTNGDALVDGCPYDAVWDDATSKLVYKPAYRSKKVNEDVVGTYARENQTGSTSETFAVNLASIGVVSDKITHVEILVQLDARVRSNNSNTQQGYVYVEVNGVKLAYAGERDIGQTSFATGSDVMSQTNSIRLFVPVTSGAISFVLGHVWQSSGAAQNEFWAQAKLYALHQFPLAI